MNNIKVSICISTWNRKNLLRKAIKSLLKQTFRYDEYEINIIDSSSTDGTDKLIDEFVKKNNNVFYYNVEKNNPQVKRNFGIKISRGDIIILLDDDVVPANESFVYAHYVANINFQNCFFSGQIRFPYEKVKSSNYFKFRDEQHYNDAEYCDDIPFYRIVSMNLSFKKKYINDKLMLDERFLGYGCEDIDFGYKIETFGYHNKYLQNAVGIHFEESRDIVEYGKKIYKMSVYGKRNLFKFNKEAYFKLKYNGIDSFSLLNEIFFNFIFKNIVEIFLLFSENISFLYCFYLYKYYIYCIYYKGFKDRRKIPELNHDWNI